MREILIMDDKEANGYYEGDLDANGLPTGYGIFTWNDGDVYSGYYSAGKRHGMGRLTLADGTIYKGEWKNDRPDGDFEILWPNNRAHFWGKMQNGKYHGFGTMNYSNGCAYSGQWVNGLCHGEGTFTQENGMLYRGEFRNDRPCGRVCLTYQGTEYVGIFSDFMNATDVTATYEDGSTRHGYIQNNTFYADDN